MKCVCGYEHEEGLYEGKWQDFLKGDEKFIQICGSIFRIKTEIYRTEDVYLYACPKCSTVQMSKW